MSNPLFLDQGFKPTFQKIAMPVRLSESPEAWQRDIAGEIYKQLPFVGEYAVNVILDRVDAQRGYGFGSAMLSNKTDSPMPDQSEMPTLRIPIVIRDYLMAPLDVFMDGSGVYPLTESRVREKLFRPETMELSTRKPSDKNLSDQLYPPMRSNYGMNSMGGGEMGMGKVANSAEAARRAAIQRSKSEAAANSSHLGSEKCASLLEAIAPTLSENDVDNFVERIVDDKELGMLAARSPVFQKLAMTIAQANPLPVQKTASALVESIRPDVVQFQKLASGDFKVKWANSQAFAPQEGVVSGQEANQMAGGDLSGMQPGATVTLSNEKAQKQSLNEQVTVKVEQFGKYCVQAIDTGSEHCGFVIPVVDFEMQPLELFVFLEPGQGPTGSGQVGTAEVPLEPQMGDPGIKQASKNVRFQRSALADKAVRGAFAGNSTPTKAQLYSVARDGAHQSGRLDAAVAPHFRDPGLGQQEKQIANGVLKGKLGPARNLLNKLAEAPIQQAIWSMQDEIAGKVSELSLEEWTMLGDGQAPQGSGMFISVSGQCCLLPLTIQNGAQGGFMGETAFGEPITVQVVQGLQAVEQMGEGSYGIPADMKWVPLPGKPVMLAKSPLDMENTQEARQMPNQVQIGSTGQGEFSMDGAPLNKVARDQRTFIKTAQAEFLLVAMGVNPFHARELLKQAEAGKLVKCAGRPIVSLASLHNEMTKQASNFLATFPNLRQDLVKEATVIDDADTADKVLSMNFINPENLSTFAKYLPELNDAAQKLAELLLGVRLGIGSVDEGAVERAMKGLEAVIEGLKMLQQKTVA